MSKRSQRRATRFGQDLTPYPTTFTPQSDPPSVRRNPVKSMSVNIEWTEQSPDGIYPLYVKDVTAQISKHTEIPKPNFVIKYISAWAAPGSYSLAIIDFPTQVSMFDEGDYVRRARAGIRYSKNIQKVYDASTQADQLCSMVTLQGDPTPDLRVGVDYWSSGLLGFDRLKYDRVSLGPNGGDDLTRDQFVVVQ